MRYRLRTLMILLAVGPMVLAGIWFALPHLPLLAVLAAMLAIPAGMLYVWMEVW